MSATRIGIVGAGYIGSRHAEVLAGFDDVRIVAVADPLPERAEPLAARLGATPYPHHGDMLDRSDLDALYICVPPFARGAIELDAVRHGLPFFAEKPLAADLSVAQSVAAAVRARGLVTAVGYYWRYLDVTERARELLDGNPARLVHGFWLVETPDAAWWLQRRLSGGQTIEQATHLLDLARLLVGEVTEVYGLSARSDRPGRPGDVDDVAVATLAFATGAIGMISSTCLLAWRHRTALHLYAENLAIELSEFDLSVTTGGGRYLRAAGGDALQREDRDFVDAVQGKPCRIRVPYEEALRTHRLACAVDRSARERRRIGLEDEAPDS